LRQEADSGAAFFIMTRSRLLLILIGACVAARSHGYRQPDPAVMPLDFFDIRTIAPAPEREALQAKGAVAEIARLRSGSGVQVRFDPRTGRVRHLFTLGGALSEPSGAAAAEIARQFLRDRPGLFGLSESEIAAMAVSSSYTNPDGRTRHVVLQQRRGGLDVFQSQIGFAIDGRGRVVQGWGEPIAGVKPVGKARLSAVEALGWAAAHCDRTQRRGEPIAPRRDLRPAVLSSDGGAEQRTVLARGPFVEPVAARLVLMPVGGGQGAPAWEMRLHLNPMECYDVVVDARDGALLYRTNLYKFAAPAGRVFVEHPDAGARVDVSFEGHPIASPAGWCDATSTTQGNNVAAREDADGNDETTPGLLPFSPALQFVFPFSNSWADTHTTAPDAAAVVTNLFYQCNWYHDFLYTQGFNEPSGNFQLDNFGRGGAPGDPVFADAMDGAGFNNSNFLTLADGDPPGPYGGHSRLQVFLFQPQPPLYAAWRDGSLDGDIILHEYSHGLASRLVGGPSVVTGLEGPQSAALAEGWADFFPCSVFDDPVMGEYVSGNAVRGARTFAYEGHPWTFGKSGLTTEITSPALPGGGPLASIFVPEVHSDGEIWAAALWELRKELGNARRAEYLVIDGLRYTPLAPTMLDARDAILLADAVRFEGHYRPAIWRAFARRGLGWSAETEVGRKASLAFQAFDWPPDMGGSFTTGPVVFQDDMEGALGGWQVRSDPLGTVAFHSTTRRADSGTTAWYFGIEGAWNYRTATREWSALESPPIIPPAGFDCFLEFSHWRQAEDTIDWQPDSAPHYFDPGFVYVRDLETDRTYQVGFVFHNTAGWERRRIDLSLFAGRLIRVGFYFDTWDPWDRLPQTYEGWFIDDVRIVLSRTVNTPRANARSVWTRY
jgi:hypothetical protein